MYENGMALCGDGHILGDSGYPNLPFLMTPFRDNTRLTASQRQFNYVHSSIRVTVEQAFGLLKGRFTRLRYICQGNIETIVDTIITACVLHICILNNDDFQDILEEDDVPQALPNPRNFDSNAQAAAACKRLAIARRLS